MDARWDRQPGPAFSQGVVPRRYAGSGYASEWSRPRLATPQGCLRMGNRASIYVRRGTGSCVASRADPACTSGHERRRATLADDETETELLLKHGALLWKAV
jgi:hypothetical protein